MSIEMLSGASLSHELLLTTSQTTKLRNATEKNMSTDIKFSKIQISKIISSGGYLGLSLIKLAGPLMKVAVPLANNILAPSEMTAVASAIDAGIQEKIHGSGATTLITSNEEMNVILKMSQLLKILEDSKGFTKTTKN